MADPVPMRKFLLDTSDDFISDIAILPSIGDKIEVEKHGHPLFEMKNKPFWTAPGAENRNFSL
jgi:hypothetical protein